jgi:diacylglycerol kinase family enzyme
LSSSTRRVARVFVNPGASYGAGRERWASVQDEVARRVGDLEVEEVKGEGGLAFRVSELVSVGERRFIAAGGDGTVNALVNALMAAAEAPPAGGENVTLGAVGLGSSNDFHKPYDESATVEGIPVHVDFDAAAERDVIRIDHTGPDGADRLRYAIINASAGVTAEANARFNEPNWLVRAARRVSVDAAITAAVATTLTSWADLTCSLSTDGSEPEMASVTNLGVYKNPHFGGALCYDTSVEPDDGVLGVALCEHMSALETVATLSALRKGRFSGRRKTRTWTARELSVHGDRPFALETDGEVVWARGARFSVAPRRLACCG